MPISVLVLALCALVVAACGSGSDDGSSGSPETTGGSATTGSTGDDDWEGVVRAAQEEGKVTFYSGLPPAQMDALAAAFEEEYGIEVETVRGIPQDLNPTVEAEFTTGNRVADVYHTVDSNWLSSNLDYLVEPSGPAFDNPEYDPGYVFDAAYFQTGSTLQPISWNTDLVPDGVDGYEDILDPQFAGGRVGIIEPANVAIVDFYVNYLEPKYGDDYLDRLAELEPRIYQSTLPTGEALGAGEISVGLFTNVETEKNATRPVEAGIPDEPWGAPFYAAILADSPNPNAARLLANFLITEAGQIAINNPDMATVFPVEGSIALSSQIQRLDFTSLTPEVQEEFRARFNELFK